MAKKHDDAISIRRASSTNADAWECLRTRAFAMTLDLLQACALQVLRTTEYLSTETRAFSKGPIDRRVDLSEEVQRLETALIKTALVAAGGNQAHAAKLLGLKYTTLSAKIKRYKIEIKGKS